MCGYSSLVFNGGIKLKFRFHFWLNPSYIQFPFNMIPSPKKKIQHKKGDLCKKRQMHLRKSTKYTPKERWTLFPGRFQKVCQFRLRMYRLFELFRRLPSAIHFYLETIIFPNFMRFQEQKPGILKSVKEVKKNSIGEILAEQNILIYILFVHVALSCLESGDFNVADFQHVLDDFLDAIWLMA